MRHLISIFLLLLVINSFSQGQANNWFFGENAGLDFNSGSPVSIANSQINTREGCSSFSDANGSLLFYSDGTTVWNRNHGIMPNGQGLEGSNSSSQSAMIIPRPGSATEYYIFTVGSGVGSDQLGFFYYTIDMTANGGLGDVVSTANNLMQGANRNSWTEKVAAVKGNECETFWVISYTNGTNEFFAYKITSAGVESTPVRSNVSFSATDVRGYLKISPDGKKLAIAHMSDRAILLYDFDDVTGIVSNQKYLPVPSTSTNDDFSASRPYGLEFSASSEKLYAHASNDYFNNDGSSDNPINHFSVLYQFDISLPTLTQINASRAVIDGANNSRNLYRGALQLGPDKKIYRALSESYDNGTAFLGVIENPEEDGLAANYQHAIIDLGGNKSSQGLPPFISSIFSQIEINSTDSSGQTNIINDLDVNLCVGDDFATMTESLPGTTIYKWFKNNATLPFSNAPNLSFSNVNSSINGLYSVVAESTDICGVVSTLNGEFTIEVYDAPIATDPSDMILCDDDNNGTMGFDLISQDGLINSVSGMSVSYYTSQLEADAGAKLTQLSSPYESGTTTIYARLENDGNTGCYDTTSFEIEVYESAFPLDSSSIIPIEECDNTSSGTDTDRFIVFDLTQRETDILNTQSSSDFTLTYFTNAGYTNQVPVVDETSFTNTIAAGQTIYVRMTNNLDATCYADTSFEIRVNELPVLNTPPFVLEQCDDDFDGFNSFNLTEINSEIVSSITTEVFTYYESSAEAEAGTSGTEIMNPTTYVNEIVNTDTTLWVRVENTDGCYRTVQVTLIVKPSAIPTSFLRTFSECDDGTDNRDGISTFDFSSVSAEVQAMFPTPVDVFYYRNQADATAELNEIVDPSAYENIGYLNMQEIWVRADSQLGNDCLGNGHHITLIVEELPTANKPTDLTECDDDGDGEFPFNSSMIEAEILNGQSLVDVTITYFNEDGTTIGTSLPSPFLTASQTIDIVIANNTTNDPEGTCTDSTTLTFVVDDSPEAATVIMTPSCDDNPNDTDGISVFDTTSLEIDILNGQTGMNVYYYDASGINPLRDSNGVVITSPFPNSFSTTNQTITVAVENPINTTCTATTTVDFYVLPNPVFDLEQETLVCENLLPHTISVESPNQNNYTYQWFNSLGVEIGIDQTLSILNIGDLTADGVDYTVTVTNPITNCSKTKSILVKASSIATITQDDIVTIEFNSPGNSIEINTTNLGIGDYEFSLEHDYDYQPFQDSPIFTELLGGIYILLVNDKNGCETTELTIVLLDYPKFLTPNNDGHNDTWKLVGIESTSFTSSPIQIFDRFGKIVAVLDPQSQGWDGYYNGSQLPASDYWFRVQLTNSEGTTLDKKGHFSIVRR